MVMVALSKVMLNAKGMESKRWILYSCRARHMKNQSKNFMTFTNAERTLHIGNNNGIASLVYGTVRFTPVAKGRKGKIMLKSILYTPDLM